MEHYQCYTLYSPNTRWERHSYVVESLPQHLIMPVLSATEQATKAAKQLIHVINNPGTQTPFTIKDIQLQAIDKLAQLFNTMQPETTQTKVVHSKVPTIAPTRVPVIVPPLRVSDEVTPPKVMTTRTPIITQEDPIYYSRQRDTVENNNQHKVKHRYPTIITHLSQEINHVESAATAATRHQQLPMNINEQVNTTPKVIDNCLKENACKLTKKHSTTI